MNPATSMHVVHFRSTVDDKYIPLKVTFTNMFKSAEGSLESEEWVLLRVADDYLGTELGDLSFVENLNASKVYEDFTYSAPRFLSRSMCAAFLTMFTRGILSSLQTLTSI